MYIAFATRHTYDNPNAFHIKKVWKEHVDLLEEKRGGKGEKPSSWYPISLGHLGPGLRLFSLRVLDGLGVIHDTAYKKLGH